MKLSFNPYQVPTPSYVVDEGLLIRNLEKLKEVKDRSGCRILLAQKAFSMFALYPLIGKYLDGTAASGLYEARLGREEFHGEVHVFSGAFEEKEFLEVVELADHVVFNSFPQLERFGGQVLSKGKKMGLRINPECSTQETALYDPCAIGSRLGITRRNFREDLLEGVSGLHFHTLCEQGVEDLLTTLRAVEEGFGDILPRMEWVNFGGGLHITKEGFDQEALIQAILRFRETYGVEVYLEPGEAVVLDTGFLVTQVLDVVDNGLSTLILDASAACHMPDVLEMPYRPPILGSGQPGEKPHTYRLGGKTCLAGDIIGDYSFDGIMGIGDRLVLLDMALYTMVKNNTFNGMPLPSIFIARRDGSLQLVRRFGYEDFRNRLS